MDRPTGTKFAKFYSALRSGATWDSWGDKGALTINTHALVGLLYGKYLMRGLWGIRSFRVRGKASASK